MKRFDVFSNEYLGKVRTMYSTETEEIFFHAVDVAKCLGYANAASVISIRVPQQDKVIVFRKELPIDTHKVLWTSTRGRGQVTFINEAALYKLILGSQIDVAEQFKDWICNTVLTSIRQNGGYIMGQEHSSDDKLKKEIQKLYLRLQKKDNALTKAQADISRLQERRHELLDELREVKAEKKDLKKNLSYMVEDSNYWYNMYMSLMEDYEDVTERLESLKTGTSGETVPSRERDEAILPDGFVVKKSEWKSYRGE